MPSLPSEKPLLAAGHICLDAIPRLESGVGFVPGVLYEAGACDLSTGGAVANVGVSLHRLGRKVRLIGKVGADPFGRIVRDILEGHGTGLSEGVVVDEGSETSYSIVLSSPGRDRTFLHNPGANATFVSADVTDEELAQAGHLHFGYPPLMLAMADNDGQELADLMRRAKEAGLSTSLDMSLPDPQSATRHVRWEELLRRTLPWVDFFVPSEDELAIMLPSSAKSPSALAESCLEMGAGFVLLKRGSQGAAGFGGSESRLAQAPCIGDASAWAGFRGSRPVFPAHEIGTTGSGDATIAGFLDALLRGCPPSECLRWACAVGAFCVEAPDAVSGVPSRQKVEERLRSEWQDQP